MLFRQRLAWNVAKGYYKQMLKKIDKGEVKQAYQDCLRALQNFRVFTEVVDHHAEELPIMKTFKAQDKCEEFNKNLMRQQLILQGELDYIQGEIIFESAIMGSENLNMDGVYDALDLFGNASKVAFA